MKLLFRFVFNLFSFDLKRYPNGTRSTFYETNATLDYDQSDVEDDEEVEEVEEVEEEEEEERQTSLNGYSSNSNTNDG